MNQLDCGEDVSGAFADGIGGPMDDADAVLEEWLAEERQEPTTSQISVSDLPSAPISIMPSRPPSPPPAPPVAVKIEKLAASMAQ